MSITVTINGTDRTSKIDPTSLRVEQILTNEVDTAQFSILNVETGITLPAFDDDVVISDGSTVIFAGKVAQVKKDVWTVAAKYATVSCVDHTMEFDRVLASRTYENTTVHDIIADLVTSYASGFTYTNVASTFSVPKITFNQIPLSQCIRKLADMVYYDWYIDENKDLHFFPSTTNAAPFSLTDVAGKHVFRSLSVSYDGSQVVNRIHVRGGEYDGDSFSDVITVSGSVTKSFNLPYKMSSLAIELDTGAGYVSKTVGVDFIDTFADFDVLYSFQTQSFRFNSALAAGNKVRFTGNPKTPVLAVMEDSASVALYGPIEKYIYDTTIKSNTIARKRAAAELLTYADTAVDARFTTYTAGLRTGMLISITAAGFSESVLIKRVIFTARTPTAFQYEVECISTKRYTFIDLLRKIITPEPTATEETEVAQTLIPASQEITVADSASGTPLNAIANNLVSYWKLNDKTTDQAQSNDLLNLKSAAYAAAKLNDGIDLEQTNAESLAVYNESITGLGLTSDFTIQAWVKVENAPGSGVRYDIVGKRYGALNQKGYVLSYYNDTGTPKLQLQISSNGNTEETLSFTTTLTAGTMYHIVVTWKASTSTAHFYKNAVDSGAVTGALTACYNTGAAFRIGGEDDVGYSVDLPASTSSVSTTTTPYSEVNDLVLGFLGQTISAGNPADPTDGSGLTRVLTTLQSRVRGTVSSKAGASHTTTFAFTADAVKQHFSLSIIPAAASSVAVANSGALSSSSFSTPLSGAISTSGSNRVLYVYVVARVSTGGFSATYNGTSMTSIYDAVSTIGGIDCRVTIFVLVAPTTGSNTLSIATGAATGFEIVATAIALSGVNQQVPHRTTGINTFDGIIDEVGVWNAVLTSGNVTSLYNSGSAYAFPFV